MLKGKRGENIKKTQNGKKSLFEVRFGFLRWLFGGFGGLFGGVGGLKILISAPEVPFLVHPNWLKRLLTTTAAAATTATATTTAAANTPASATTTAASG